MMNTTTHEVITNEEFTVRMMDRAEKFAVSIVKMIDMGIASKKMIAIYKKSGQVGIELDLFVSSCADRNWIQIEIN